MSETAKSVGEAFPCPNCGASDWRADYYQAVSQGVTVVVNEDGSPGLEDWNGDEDTFDDGSTEEECLRCVECSHEISLGTFHMLSDDEWAALKATPALLRALRHIEGELAAVLRPDGAWDRLSAAAMRLLLDEARSALALVQP